jgi:hypothetical protein
LTDKYTAVWSNVNASKTPYNLNGKKQLGVFYFVPTTCKISNGFSVISVGQWTQFGCFGDEHTITDRKEFVEIFERKNRENLKSVDTEIIPVEVK